MPPPQKKFEFLPKNGVFWCILRLLFKIGQANGGGVCYTQWATKEPEGPNRAGAFLDLHGWGYHGATK